MKKLINLINLLIILCFLNSCEKISESAVDLNCTIGNTNHPNASKYEALMKKLLSTGIPGVSMTVITPDGIWSAGGGFADIKNNIKMKPCHELRIGSASKLFCAATIMKLQDEGKLNIQDKANKYVPKAICDKIPNGNSCTIQQLLNHTAGIPEYLQISKILGILNFSIVKQTAEENLLTLDGKKADFEAGSQMYYSNSNYLMLSLVIKYLTGKNAYDIVKEKITSPLFLENIHLSSTIPNTLCRGYFDVHDNGKIIDRTVIDNNAVGGQDMLDGGVIANSLDLATYLRSLMNGNILSNNSLSQMKNFRNITQELDANLQHIKQYGLGLMRLETNHGEAIGHYGSVHCFNSLVFHFPKQNVTFAIIRNGDSAKMKQFFESKELFDYIY